VTEAPKRLRAIIAAVWIAGWTSAAVIYVTARPPAANPLGDPEDTKSYLREMELYGGKANLLAYDIREWLASLWHGRRLAATVAVLTAVAALLIWFFGRPMPDENPEDGVSV